MISAERTSASVRPRIALVAMQVQLLAGRSVKLCMWVGIGGWQSLTVSGALAGMLILEVAVLLMALENGDVAAAASSL
jgi:hypothetical protein